MWLTKIDKHNLWNSKVELTLWSLHNEVEKLGGSFEIEDKSVIFRNPYTKTTYIATPFCNACKYESYGDKSICRSCTNASHFSQKNKGDYSI